MNPNLSAFLSMIAISEGTAGLGDRGYNVLVGGTLFKSYADHPRIRVDLGRGLVSTAAGRYQILERYFDAYKRSLLLPDFSPGSQDRIAVEMTHEQGAFPDIVAGRLDAAVWKVANIWASFPGATAYRQRQNSIADLTHAFTAAGGTLA